MAVFRALRRLLDAAYRLAGYCAAVFLVMILGFVTLQMMARWAGVVVTGMTEFTGYSMAAASFLALPYSLNSGSHIRVGVLLNGLGRYRRIGELWCWGVAAVLTVIFARYAVKLTLESYRFHDISQGQDAWPLWIPQVSMVVGTVLFAVCAIDNLLTAVATGKDNMRSHGIDVAE